MTTKDLIDSLRVCSNPHLGCRGCKVPVQDYKCTRRLREEAANRLEELTAELEKVNATLTGYLTEHKNAVKEEER